MGDLSAEQKRLNYLSWFSVRDNSRDFEACYVKVLVLNSTNAYVHALSYVGQYSNEQLNLTTGVSLYGEQIVYAERNIASQAVCVEVKHPGEVSHHDPTPADYEDWDKDATKLQIVFRDQQCHVPICHISKYSEYLYDVNASSNTSLTFLLHDGEFYGNNFGVYCVKGQSTPDMAKSAALHQCMTETSQVKSDWSAQSVGYKSKYSALEIDCTKGNIWEQYRILFRIFFST